MEEAEKALKEIPGPVKEVPEMQRAISRMEDIVSLRKEYLARHDAIVGEVRQLLGDQVLFDNSASVGAAVRRLISEASWRYWNRS